MFVCQLQPASGTLWRGAIERDLELVPDSYVPGVIEWQLSGTARCRLDTARIDRFVNPS